MLHTVLAEGCAAGHPAPASALDPAAPPDPVLDPPAPPDPDIVPPAPPPLVVALVGPLPAAPVVELSSPPQLAAPEAAKRNSDPRKAVVAFRMSPRYQEKRPPIRRMDG
jgi:hypothetical protein